MKELTKQYEATKQKALRFMRNGQLPAYLKALNELNNYKNLMISVRAN